MDCWATIRISYSSEELKKKLNQILNCLDMPADEDKYVLFTDNNSILLNYLSTKGDLQGSFCLETDLYKQETYIIVSLITNENQTEFLKYEKKLNQIPHIKWQYYYFFAACLDDMVAVDDHNELLKVISKILEIQDMEIYRQGNVTSMAGLSPVVRHNGQKSIINGKLYNVQVAIRNSLEDRITYIYFGTPLIIDDY